MLLDFIIGFDHVCFEIQNRDKTLFFALHLISCPLLLLRTTLTRLWDYTGYVIVYAGEKKADSMNLGIGFGLIYLFNATKNELNKIVEIRREMEILLHNSNMEFQNQRRMRSNVCGASNSTTKISHYDSDCVEQFACSSDIEEESEITCSHDHPLNCKLKKRNERNLEMNQLEAELEVELERLQFHLDSDVMLKYPTQQDLEVCCRT